MTHIRRSLLLVCAALLPAGAALAQMTPPMTTAGTCTGTIGGSMNSLSGKVYLVNGNTQINPTTTTNSSGVFSLADCQCKTRDILMRIILDATGVVPRGVLVQSMSIPIFIGEANCYQLLSRQQSVCDDRYSSVVKLSAPLTVANFQSTAPIDIPIPGEILADPQNPRTPDTSACPCENKNTSHYITVGVGDAASDISAYCQLSLPVRTIPPPAPTISGGDVRSGNNSLNLNWYVSSQDNQNIQYYQILCRDTTNTMAGADDTVFGQEGGSNPYSPYYSTCVNGVMHRGVAVFSIPGGTLPGGTPDGGATMSVPMPTTQSLRPAGSVKTAGLPGGGVADWAPRGPVPRGPLDVDGGTADGGAADMSTDDGGPDGGSCQSTGARTLFQLLDPRYLCSGKIQGSGPDFTARVEGLQNGRTYELMVVSIDYFGNPSPSVTVTGTPMPTYNLLEGLGPRYSGFCSAAGAGAEGRAGLLLPWLALLWIWRRRRGAATGTR